MTRCLHQHPILNLRPWPGQPIAVGECSACMSTLSFPVEETKALPDFSGLEALLRAHVERLRLERIARGSFKVVA